MPVKAKYTMDQFLMDVLPDNLPFVMEVHENLTQRGYQPAFPQHMTRRS